MAPSNRIAIVTGATRGLGREIAAKLEAAGCYVIAMGRHTVDVTNAAAVQELVDDVSKINGFIDVLVNNAAMLGPVGNLERTEPDEWETTLGVNLIGPMHFIRACLPHMKAQGAGKIVNVGGGGAADPLPGRTAYACSKAALVRLTDSIAMETFGSGIDINAVAPGPMATDMMEEILSQDTEAEKPEAGRWPIERAANLVTWLCSDDSDGLSGRYISARHDPWPFSPEQIADIMVNDHYSLRRAVP